MVADEFRCAANCYCSRCRAATGSAFPSEHIYVGSKAPWFEITDDLPQHEEL